MKEDNNNLFAEFLNEATANKDKSIPEPLDCSKISVDAIVEAIHTQVNIHRDNGSSTNKAFYAGICKDVEGNMKRHCNDWYVSLIDCGTRERAGEVEMKLDELGFDVGAKPDNGGDEETTIIYVIKMDRNFRR